MVPGIGYEFEVCGSEGHLRTQNDCLGVRWRRTKEPWRLLEEEPFPASPPESGTVRGIQELLAALDGEGEPSGGIRTARASMEMILGFIASHRAGGARLPLPLADRALTVKPEGW
jgi:hypothetical protein